MSEEARARGGGAPTAMDDAATRGGTSATGAATREDTATISGLLTGGNELEMPGTGREETSGPVEKLQDHAEALKNEPPPSLQDQDY